MMNLRQSGFDIPDEILLEIASCLTDHRDLTRLLLVNKRFHACLESLTWRSVSSSIKDPEYDYGGVPHYIVLSNESLPTKKWEWIKAIKLYIDPIDQLPDTTFDLQKLVEQCPKIEHIDITIRLECFELSTLGMRLVVLRLHSHGHGDIRMFLRSYNGLKNALSNPHLRHVELASLCGIDDALRRIAFKERSLSIKHLTIIYWGNDHTSALCVLLSAIRDLTSLHLEAYNFDDQADEPTEENVQLSEALEKHARTLRTVTISTDQCSKIEATGSIGCRCHNLDFANITALTNFSAPVVSLYADQLVEKLPSSLQNLQLQIDSHPESRDSFSSRRTQTISLHDAILARRPEQLPNLRTLTWWYTTGDVEDWYYLDMDDEELDMEETAMKDARTIDRTLFTSQIDRFAAEGIDLRWVEATSVQDTRFGTWPTVPMWRPVRVSEDVPRISTDDHRRILERLCRD